MAWQRVIRDAPSWIRRQWPRGRVRRFVVRLAITTCVLALILFVFPWIGYRISAPSGWHNSTVHGSIVGLEYAVSHDNPGLILACGDSLEPAIPHILATIPRCWRTQDGGSEWTTIQSPPIPDHSFHLIVPRADAETFFAVGNRLRFNQSSPEPVLVTHDAGATWRQVAQTSGDVGSAVDLEDALASGIYRDGNLYVLLVPEVHSDGALPQDFAVSGDDGKTWTRTERSPSALEKAGWSVTSFAADYQSSQSWYRTLENKDGRVMLEQSRDDGVSWSAVQEIKGLRASRSHIIGFMTLATTPAQPTLLCAAGFGIWLAASGDGGATWRGGPSEIDLSSASGYAPSAVQIGNDGACYRAYTYQITPGGIIYTSSDEGGPWYNAILRLDPRAQRSDVVPLSSDFGLTPAPVGPAGAPGWWYVPAGNGMSARIAIVANQQGVSLAGMLEWPMSTTYDMLLWRPMA